MPLEEKWHPDNLEGQAIPYFEALDSSLVYHLEDAYLHYRKGLNALRKGELVAGINLLSHAAELAPEDYLNYLGYVKMHYLRDFEGAEKDFKRSLKLGKKEDLIVAGRTNFRLGISLLQQGKYEEALRYFPDEKTFSYSLVYRGIAKHKMGDSMAALADFDTALQKFEKCPEAFYHKAKVLLDLGEKEKACKAAQKALMYENYIWSYPGIAHIEQLYPDKLGELFDIVCR